MSSRAKQLSDRVIDLNHCFYHPAMYTNFPGSVLICYTMFEKPSDEEKQKIKDKWRKISKKASKYYHTPEQYYDPKYTLKTFGLEKTFDWPVAVFVGKTNTLLAPYDTLEDGRIFAYPLREDGFSGPTLAHPLKAHVLKWNSADDNSLHSNIS